jgi:hypothetical protein
MSAHPPSDTDLAPFAEDEVPAVDGRVPGRRGRQTRDRLLSATARAAGHTLVPGREGRRHRPQVGTSPATFYQYFPGVEAAVQLLARRVVEDGAELVTLLSGRSWRGREAWEASLGLVDVFLDFWQENAAVLRVIDLAIVEGDRRFRDIRDDLLGPVTDELAGAIAERRDADDDEARAEASILVSMLAHVAEHQAGDEAGHPPLATCARGWRSTCTGASRGADRAPRPRRARTRRLAAVRRGRRPRGRPAAATAASAARARRRRGSGAGRLAPSPSVRRGPRRAAAHLVDVLLVDEQRGAPAQHGPGPVHRVGHVRDLGGDAVGVEHAPGELRLGVRPEGPTRTIPMAILVAPRARDRRAAAGRCRRATHTPPALAVRPGRIATARRRARTDADEVSDSGRIDAGRET